MARKRIDDFPRLKKVVDQTPAEWVVTLVNRANPARADGRQGESSDVMIAADPLHLASAVEALPAHYLKNAELIAAYILDQAEPEPDRLAELMAQDALSDEQLADYRNGHVEIARSAWRYLFARPFFNQVDRTHRLRNFRDVKRLFDTFSLSTPHPFAGDTFDSAALAQQLAEDLDLSEGCEVNAWLDPLTEGDVERWVVAITTAGQFTSVRTYKKDRGIDQLTYLPAREIVLSYTPAAGLIEICSEDRMLRKKIAEAFAADVLGVDLTSDPLNWKVFSLWPLRNSLHLDVPPLLCDQVKKVSVVEFGISMGPNGQSLTLRTQPGEEAEHLAPRVLGAAHGLPGSGRITHAKIHVEYVKQGNGKLSSFGMTVSGKNSCSIANQREPERRNIGEALLAHWKIMERFRDLRQEEFAMQIRPLLRLLDHGELVDRDTLGYFGANVAMLSQAALIRRKGLEDICLIEEDGSIQSGEIGGHRADGTHEVNAADGVPAATVPADFVEHYVIDVERIVQKLAEFLSPLQRTGKIVREAERVWRLGQIPIDGRVVPVWLASGLSEAGTCGAVNRHLRGMPNLVNGVVFAAGDAPFTSLATHPLIALESCLTDDGAGPAIDPVTVAQGYAREIVQAKAGEAVVFKKWKPGLAQLIVPGQLPLLIDGAARVTIVENLTTALRVGAPGLSIADTMKGTRMAHPQTAFGKDWKEINGKYVRSAGRGLWTIAI